MPHTTIYFLTQTGDYEQAEYRVNLYLETENFFDYFRVMPESSGTLEQKLDEITEYVNGVDYEKTAESFLGQAEEYKANRNFCLYGYYLIKAGELYAQDLTIGSYVFNIDAGNYSIPTGEKDWWVITIDFHY
jgi:hypothetical protein